MDLLLKTVNKRLKKNKAILVQYLLCPQLGVCVRHKEKCVNERLKKERERRRNGALEQSY